VSGRHRRPEADALPGVDVAERLEAGPVVETPGAVPAGLGRHAGHAAPTTPPVPSTRSSKNCPCGARVRTVIPGTRPSTASRSSLAIALSSAAAAALRAAVSASARAM